MQVERFEQIVRHERRGQQVFGSALGPTVFGFPQCGLPFVDLEIAHPFIMVIFLVLTCISFALFGFIIGLWATNFEKLQLIPMLVITPLVFLGGSFYSVSMLPPVWQTVTLFNPVLYLISGFRWSFFEVADVSVGISLAMISIFLLLCLGVVWWMFRTGYRLRQ